MSKIEWTDETWNPVIGCSKASPGCDNCYAERMAARLVWMGRGGANVPVEYDSVVNTQADPMRWNGHTKLVPDALEKPLRWKKPRRIFVCSMGDLFHESVPFRVIHIIMLAIVRSRQHTFQVLTKRAGRMAEYFTRLATDRNFCVDAERALGFCGGGHSFVMRYRRGGHLPNLWLGVTAENQAMADQRIPHLLKCPAAVRFVSIEPMLGPVDLSAYLRSKTTMHTHLSIEGAIHHKSFDGFSDENGLPAAQSVVEEMLRERLAAGEKCFPMCDCSDFDPQTGCPGKVTPGLDWIICGGESGPGARPMHPDWVRSLRDQCQAANVPFLFKQWGEWVTPDQSESYSMPPKGTIQPWLDNDYTEVAKLGKKAAGRKLDGVTHDEFPEDRRIK